ncbi:MAG: branched-chain amino acid ABC transporter permease [Firmicutes bacterium]|jgi:branched-chain amino acid transport system permease protein|nr:branched-chain amino acid ABC transporter permease [Bacillota bacterium]
MYLQLLTGGLLLGCIYGLVAMGLSLIYGVMGIVNFAHGAFVMLAMYASYWLYALLRLDPVLSTPLVAALMFGFGAGCYYLVIGRVLRGPFLARLLVTFGLGIFFVSLAQFLWTPDYKMVDRSIAHGIITIGGVFIEGPKLAASIGSLAVAAAVYWFVRKTKTGLAIQAISIDRMASSLMGINLERLNAIAFGLGIASAGAAGSLMASFYYIFPDVGTMFGLVALVAVALGGFGSTEGALIGAILLGVIETFGGFVVGPAYKYALIFVAYLLIVIIRPRGLMGWGAD